MKLLLSGGIATEKAKALNGFFASHIDRHGTVRYIPAANEALSEYDESFEGFKHVFRAYGIADIQMCRQLQGAVITDQCVAIYFDGGNTYKLLKEVRESGFDRQISAFVRRGGFVYGRSAGSILFGKDIAATTFEDENTVAYGDSRGLNMVKGFDICCHYGGDEETTAYKRNRILKYAAQSNGTIALPDDAGIYVADDSITFMGGGIVIFRQAA